MKITIILIAVLLADLASAACREVDTAAERRANAIVENVRARGLMTDAEYAPVLKAALDAPWSLAWEWTR